MPANPDYLRSLPDSQPGVKSEHLEPLAQSVSVSISQAHSRESSGFLAPTTFTEPHQNAEYVLVEI